MSTPNANEILNAGFWGWQTTPEGTAYRVRLPPTKAFPLTPRTISHGGLGFAVAMPPYLAASLEGRGIDVMICIGAGRRAALPGVGRDPHWVYADGPYVPEEWKEIIHVAIAEISEHWPDKPFIFRPSADFDPMVN